MLKMLKIRLRHAAFHFGMACGSLIHAFRPRPGDLAACEGVDWRAAFRSGLQDNRGVD